MDDIKMDVERNHRFRIAWSFEPQNGWGDQVEGMKVDMFQPDLYGARSIPHCLFYQLGAFFG